MGISGFEWAFDSSRRILKPRCYGDSPFPVFGDVNILQGVTTSGASENSWGFLEHWALDATLNPFLGGSSPEQLHGHLRLAAKAPLGGA